MRVGRIQCKRAVDDSIYTPLTGHMSSLCIAVRSSILANKFLICPHMPLKCTSNPLSEALERLFYTPDMVDVTL